MASEGYQLASSYFNAGTIGDGGFATIKLYLDREKKKPPVAVKCFHSSDSDDESFTDVVGMYKREALIARKATGHRNIIKYLGSGLSNNGHRIYYEYADCGDLIDLIEPGIGMNSAQAVFYFQQVLNGVEHLHSIGVAHRDLKPDNMLLTNEKKVLKIADFGFATVFRVRNVERMLDTECGTIPYTAPEVYSGTYKGSLADVWSCGVVLAVMLTGELLWDRSTGDDPKYAAWLQTSVLTADPWRKIETAALDLLRRILQPNMVCRPQIKDIRGHPYLKCQEDILAGCPSTKIRRVSKAIQDVTISQPESLLRKDKSKTMEIYAAQTISQPYITDLDDCDGRLQSQTDKNNPHVALASRSTRLMVKLNLVETKQKILELALQLGYTPRELAVNQILIKRNDLSLVITFFQLAAIKQDKVAIDFRRSRGDGIEFKKAYLNFKKQMSDIIFLNDCLDNFRLSL